MWRRFSRLGTGSAVAGFGLALAISIFDWKNVEMPGWVFAALLVLAVVLILGGLFVMAWCYIKPDRGKIVLEHEPAAMRFDVKSERQMGGQTAGIIANIGPQRRTLKNTDTETVVSRLSGFKGTEVTVACLLGDAESCQFAEEIKGLLERSGWTVRGIDQEVHGVVLRGVILMHPSRVADSAMEELGRCLSHMGFQISPCANREGPTRRVLVGSGD